MALAPHSRPPSPSPFARSSPGAAASLASCPRPSSRLEHRRYTISPSTMALSNLVLGPSPPRPSPAPTSSSSSLLPSFGRFLPPPHPALSHESPGPRYHSSSNSLGWASLRSSTSTPSTSISADSPRPLGKRINGGKLVARAPSPARTRPAPPLTHQQLRRRTSSPGPVAPQLWTDPPAHDPSRQSALPPSRTATIVSARAPSPIRRSRSFHPSHDEQQHVASGRSTSSTSSSSGPSSSSSAHARPSSLDVPVDNRASLRRTHSKVELDSPGPESIPPSPTASAHLSPAERHRTVRSNAPGFRSLVRRASLTTADERGHDERESVAVVEEVRPRATLGPPPKSPPPAPPTTRRHSHVLQRRPSTSTPHAIVASSPPPRKPFDFPPDDPRIPPQRRSSSSAGAVAPTTDEGHGIGSGKRTIFNPYELSVLQALWARGMYYPPQDALDEVVRRTGMTRVQARNWFANKRQRSSGEEKKRVAKMAKDISLAA